MELTVAIPTMRRWDKFLSKSLPTYLNHPFVKNVLICDETGEDIAAIRASEWANHPKLILKQNERRLGIYHNKRQCIELAPTEWVGVFDSDNFFDTHFFDQLEALWKAEGADPKAFYAPGNGLFVNEDRSPPTNPIGAFAGTKITLGTWNDIFNLPQWNYMLNDGNWIVPRSVLSLLPTDVKNEDVLATDAIYMARLFVKGGYTYDIRTELQYIHVVHKGSSWIADSAENNRIWESTNWKI